MDNLDRFLRCIRNDRELPNGDIDSGHNFRPMHARIEGETLHLDMRCAWCTLIVHNSKPYEGESPSEIKELYGFRLDDPFESV